ncbi:unnamed protein product [Caenorhabditis angaria]|uniref:Transcription factor CBF/NF-Y/archaeal histone domain-containing protein n=1 Tax=Caenorhabditis angaria TaxID=860376 RepID=A0A9P1IA42_9PELO|nr:unnamed protein product [Caenorhabditis angaria]
MALRRKQNKKNEPIIPMTNEEVTKLEEHVNELLHSQLPLGRVKKICRLDPDVEMINSEAIRLMTKAAELFIIELGKASNTNAILEKRKTVQLKDIEKSIQKMWTFAFLEDALDGWPKHEPKKRKAATENNENETSILEETVNEEEEDDNLLEDTLNDNEEEEGEEENGESGNEEEDEEIGETQPMIDKFAEQF